MDAVVDVITGQQADAILVGVAVLTLIVSIKVFQWVRGAL